MNIGELKQLAETVNGWKLDTVIPETEDACCKVGTTLDGEFYEVMILECEDYYKDSEELAAYIIATQPPVVLSLISQIEAQQAALVKCVEALRKSVDNFPANTQHVDAIAEAERVL